MTSDEYENRIKQAYAEGFAAARNRAQAIADIFCYCGHILTDPECSCCRIAKRIGDMKPGEGK